MQLKLSSAQLEQLITQGFAQAEKSFVIEELRPYYVRTRTPFVEWMRRPGDLISGPALFGAADLAMYLIVLAHLGPALMAVTSDMNIRFLNRARPGDILAEGTLLKLGSKLAVLEVKLRCGDDPALVAHVTGSYSLPAGAPSSPPPA